MTASHREYQERALELAQEIIIVDGHIDVPYWLHSIYHEDISERTIGGDFDYPRAVQGGLDAAFMAIYVPPAFQKDGGAKEHAEQLIDLVESIVEDAPDKFAGASSPADIRANRERNLVSLPLGLENGAAFEDDVEQIAYFFDRGIRYVTLTHAKDNSICDSSYDDTTTWQGLSDFGREVVVEMNRLGMIVDVSHVSDNAFHQILEMSTAPPVATHSSVRSFTPGWERNIDDEMIRLLAEAEGIVMINFGSDFLSHEYSAPAKSIRKRVDSDLKRRKLDRSTLEGFKYLSKRRAAKTLGTVADVAAHVEHVANLVGVEHVGLGSDFDGVFTFPKGLQDVSGYPNLIAALLQRGFADDEIKSICGENFLRVWKTVLDLASPS